MCSAPLPAPPQIIHDYEHKGVNNDYLIRVSDGLAVLYNDRSPMENHHLASSFQLMNSDEYNFLRKMPHKTRVRACMGAPAGGAGRGGRAAAG